MNWEDFCGALGVPNALCGAAGPEITAVSTDSRTVKPGQAFFCIRGENFDGHDFASKAMEQGAAVVVADRELESSGVPVLVVDDTIRALGRLANAWRKKTKARVVGVTGTAGKTTVKEVLASVLGRCGRVAKNALNHNNQIGLPQSMLAADGMEDFWVMEVGISQEGDMDDLGAILEPDVALILNAGAGHTAGLGRAVARHKARLLAWLAPGGTGVVCADYPDLAREARAVRPAPAQMEFFTAGGKPLFYSGGYLGAASKEGADGLSGIGGRESTEGQDNLSMRGRFRVCLGAACREMEAPFRGNYGTENVMAVSAVTHLLGLGIDDIAAGLAEAVLPRQRFACSRAGAWLLVDDSYNANPLSSARMLESCSGMAADMARAAHTDVPLVCVLGEMLELGEAAGEEHEKLGRHIAACTPRLVLWKGGHAADVRGGLNMAGYGGVFIELGTEPGTDADVAGILDKHQLYGGVILFKGSRGNRLEEHVARFRTLVESPDAV